jgi:hypothetical protein
MGCKKYEYANSSIFGVFDSASKQRITHESLRDTKFDNQILKAPSKQGILIAEIAIPYRNGPQKLDSLLGGVFCGDHAALLPVIPCA